jgi:hypothetical protein
MAHAVPKPATLAWEIRVVNVALATDTVEPLKAIARRCIVSRFGVNVIVQLAE